MRVFRVSDKAGMLAAAANAVSGDDVIVTTAELDMAGTDFALAAGVTLAGNSAYKNRIIKGGGLVYEGDEKPGVGLTIKDLEFHSNLHFIDQDNLLIQNVLVDGDPTNSVDLYNACDTLPNSNGLWILNHDLTAISAQLESVIVRRWGQDGIAFALKSLGTASTGDGCAATLLNCQSHENGHQNNDQAMSPHDGWAITITNGAYSVFGRVDNATQDPANFTIAEGGTFSPIYISGAKIWGGSVECVTLVNCDIGVTGGTRQVHLQADTVGSVANLIQGCTIRGAEIRTYADIVIKECPLLMTGQDGGSYNLIIMNSGDHKVTLRGCLLVGNLVTATRGIRSQTTGSTGEIACDHTTMRRMGICFDLPVANVPTVTLRNTLFINNIKYSQFDASHFTGVKNYVSQATGGSGAPDFQAMPGGTGRNALAVHNYDGLDMRPRDPASLVANAGSDLAIGAYNDGDGKPFNTSAPTVGAFVVSPN